MTERNEDIRVHIVEHIAVLSKDDNGWKKELTLTQWNGNGAKYDIRSWNEDYSRCSRGITLTPDELACLLHGMSNREEDNE